MNGKIPFGQAILAVVASVVISGYYATSLLEQQMMRIVELDARARTLESLISPHIDYLSEANKILSPMDTKTVKHLLMYLQALCYEYDVPYGIAKGVITVESSWMPGAKSSTGARGLMQVTPLVGRTYNISKDQLFDPYLNISVGVQYLAQLYKEFGDWNKALTAYSHGPTSTRKYSVQYQTNNNYTQRVLSWAAKSE